MRYRVINVLNDFSGQTQIYINQKDQLTILHDALLDAMRAHIKVQVNPNNNISVTLQSSKLKPDTSRILDDYDEALSALVEASSFRAGENRMGNEAKCAMMVSYDENSSKTINLTGNVLTRQ